MGQQPAWRRSPAAHSAEKSKIWGKAQAGQGEQLGQRVLAAGLDAWPSEASSHHAWQVSTKGNSAVFWATYPNLWLVSRWRTFSSIQ